LFLTSTLWGQSSPAQPQAPSSPTSSQQPATPAQPQNPQQPGDSQTQVPGTGTEVQDPQQGSDAAQGADQTPDQPEPEGHITKQQAKDLFRSVDEILGFVSGDTGLPIEHKVNR